MSPPLHARVSRALRVRKRISVRYGPSYPLLGSGFTSNLSSQGLAISGSSLHLPGTRLHLDLRLSSECTCQVEGSVVWAMRGSPAIGQQNVLGIEITGADETFYRFLQTMPGLTPGASAVAPADRAPISKR